MHQHRAWSHGVDLPVNQVRMRPVAEIVSLPIGLDTAAGVWDRELKPVRGKRTSNSAIAKRPRCRVGCLRGILSCSSLGSRSVLPIRLSDN